MHGSRERCLVVLEGDKALYSSGLGRLDLSQFQPLTPSTARAELHRLVEQNATDVRSLKCYLDRIAAAFSFYFGFNDILDADQLPKWSLDPRVLYCDTLSWDEESILFLSGSTVFEASVRERKIALIAYDATFPTGAQWVLKTWTAERQDDEGNEISSRLKIIPLGICDRQAADEEIEKAAMFHEPGDVCRVVRDEATTNLHNHVAHHHRTADHQFKSLISTMAAGGAR